MSDDLAAFMAARIGEVEAIARAASGEAAEAGDAWHEEDPVRRTGLIRDQDGGVVVYDEGSPTAEQAAHIALHDPARELREVEAKWRRLRRWIEHDRLAAERRAEGRPSPATENIRDACWVAVLDDASVWSDHPGCRPEWNPDMPGVTPLTS